MRIELESQYDILTSTARLQVNSKYSFSSPDGQSFQSHSSHIKLPTIELPSFDGDLSKWMSFKDTFEALIHNDNGLSDVQKLCYMRSSLKGDALKTIQCLKTTNSNYRIAYETITNKFSHRRRIVYSHVMSLLNHKCVQLKESINSIEQNLCCLNALEVDTRSWDPILVPLILNKIDKRLVQEWELHVSTTYLRDFLPETKDLLKFLTERSEIFNTINLKQNTQSDTVRPLKANFT